MPIEQPQNLIWKIQKLYFVFGSSALIRLAPGYLDENSQFVSLGAPNKEISIPWADMLIILQQAPTTGKTRYEDIADALYGYVLESGAVQGQIV